MDFRCHYSASIHFLLSERINKTLRETWNYNRLYHFFKSSPNSSPKAPVFCAPGVKIWICEWMREKESHSRGQIHRVVLARTHLGPKCSLCAATERASPFFSRKIISYSGNLGSQWLAGSDFLPNTAACVFRIAVAHLWHEVSMKEKNKRPFHCLEKLMGLNCY